MAGLRQALWCLLAVGTLVATPVLAQNTVTRSPVLVIDTEAVFEQSVLGQRFRDDIQALADEIQAENDQLATELEQEELALVEQRKTMSAEAFRPLADAFDQKTQRIRQERVDRDLEFRQLQDTLRRDFLTAADPVFVQIMQERGAAVIIDQRSVFRFARVIDVTDAVIAALNAGDAAPEPPSE